MCFGFLFCKWTDRTCVCMRCTNEAVCVCGTKGFSLNTQRPRELPRAERTASVCVLVPSKQGNLENTKGAANKHNLIPLSSHTWFWIMRYSKDVSPSLCNCVCIMFDAMPERGWPKQEGSLYVFCTCISMWVHEQICGMRMRPFIFLQWEAWQCCWEMAGLCPITPWCLCLLCQAAPKCLPRISGTEVTIYCTQRYMNARLAGTTISRMDASHNGQIVAVLLCKRGKKKYASWHLCFQDMRHITGSLWFKNL